MSKFTTAGALLIKSQMPTEEAKKRFDPYRPLDKKAIGDMVNMLIHHGGETAHEHINNLGKTFFNKATEIGATTPLSDYINESDERQAIIDEFDHKVQNIFKQKGQTAQERNRDLVNLTGQYNTKIEKQNLEYLVAKGSVAAKMAQTGARGNPAQLATGTSTPLMSPNMRGELVPVVIKSSFAKGMTPAEQLAMSYMGRGNTVLAQLSTALPGALFKRLSPTTFHEVISMDDCKTHNGIDVDISDKKSLLGRYTAHPSKLITEEYLKELSSSGVKKVRVRSSMTCEAHEGVCRKCYGLMGSGKLPDIGENIGVIASQSISEVLTQAMLATKHKANVGERKGNAYEQASNLLNNPSENFKDEATIATLNGTVTAIKKTPLGDNNVYVNEKAHFVPRVQSILVKVNEKVRQGDPLSTGVINPRKLVSMRGIGAGRKYMADELRNIYGGGLDPRHFEIVSRNMIKHVEVDDPGETGFMPGQKVPVSQVAKFLDGSKTLVPVEQGEGKVLAKGVYELTPGTLLDHNHIEDLKNSGVKEIHVTGSGLRVTPVVPGLQTAKLLDSDWVSKLSFAKLKDTLRESAALGQTSAVHGYDPITPYIMGSEFGEGKDGKY